MKENFQTSLHSVIYPVKVMPHYDKDILHKSEMYTHHGKLISYIRRNMYPSFPVPEWFSWAETFGQTLLFVTSLTTVKEITVSCWIHA